MLDGLRQAAQGGIGRIVMAVVMTLIIISFVIWGVGDMFRGFTSDKVATVGSTSITAAAYQREYQNFLYRYQQQTRQPLTNAQAHAIGFDRQILERMIDEAALDERARALGLGMSYETIADAARSDPKLLDASGKFSRDLFDQALRDSGLTERAFFNEQRAIYLRQQLEFALVGDLAAPKALVEALDSADTETRAIDYFVVPRSAVGDIAAPAPETLKSYFEERKANYRAPEMRSFEQLLINPATLAKPEDVSDDDAKAVYDKDKDTHFATPEKRQILQMVFPSEADASAALAKIKGGESFADVAKERKLAEADYDLGEITKADIFDPKIADAAFSISEGAVSDVVKGQFGFTLIEAAKVIAGSVKPFADVEADIKKQIATSRASDAVLNTHDKIEDARVSGKSLADAAKVVGVEMKTIGPVDAEGNDANGQPVDMPEKESLLRAVFGSDIGADDAPLNTHERGYLWFAVAKVDPAHDRTFDEVKDKVEAEWRQGEQTKALAAKAADLVKQLDSGAAIADLAKGLSLEVKSASGITRRGGADLAPAVVAAVFAGPADKAGAADSPEGRVVFKVTKDETPAFDAAAPSAKSLSDKLAQGLQNGVVDQYIEAVKKEAGVSVNPQTMQIAVGG